MKIPHRQETSMQIGCVHCVSIIFSLISLSDVSLNESYRLQAWRWNLNIEKPLSLLPLRITLPIRK